MACYEKPDNPKDMRRIGVMSWSSSFIAHISAWTLKQHPLWVYKESVNMNQNPHRAPSLQLLTSSSNQPAWPELSYHLNHWPEFSMFLQLAVEPSLSRVSPTDIHDSLWCFTSELSQMTFLSCMFTLDEDKQINSMFLWMF